MKVTSKWVDKMSFTAEVGLHSASMDAKPPIGGGNALTPKELVVAGLCGCTGMDVVAFLKKYKQPLDGLKIEAEVISTEGAHPVVFSEIKLNFLAIGSVDGQKLLEAIRLSQTKYCGVSAMLSKAVSIKYEVHLNSENIGSGKADFS